MTQEGYNKLWNAANYLFRSQMGDHNRVEAMDLIDNIRRNNVNLANE